MGISYVFRYRLQDAWLHSITEIDVLSGVAEGNVRATLLSDWYPKAEQTVLESHEWTIGTEAIDKIKDAIERNKDVFSIGEIEPTLVLDGVVNWFYLETEDQKKEIIACNLWCFNAPNKKKLVMGEGNNGMTLLNLYHEVAEILIESGVDKRFLQLNTPVGTLNDMAGKKRRK